jgi:molybdopterin-guanine dinucleotide biosynthesis protein A
MQPEAADAIAVVILAGGEASRFPGKLASDAGGVPLLLRVYRNVRELGPVYVAANGPLGEGLAREMDCTVVADGLPRRGPLGGLVSAFQHIGERRCFAVAGDAPFVGRDVFLRLRAAWDDRCEAVVAESGGGMEPLCAIYAREAFLRAARSELEAGSGAVRAVVERLTHVRVRIQDERALASINTPADRATLLGLHS